MIFVAGSVLLGCASENAEGSGEPSLDMSMAAGSAARSGAGGAGEAAANAPAPAMSSAGAGAAGASAGASAPPSGPERGMFMPRPPLDPNVVFDWPATLPGGGDTCQPGTYTGTFMCTLNAGVLLPPPPDGVGVVIIGPVTLQFERSMDGEFLELTEGRLEGLALASWGFVAELEGRLDCTTLQFTAQASSGVYGLGLPIGAPVGTFGGTLSGALDRQTLELSGEWALIDDVGHQGCNGPWAASLTP